VFRLSHLELSGDAGNALSEAGPELWRAVLHVRVDNGTNADTPPSNDTPPLAGDYSFTEDGVEFRSRFPLQAGLTYWTSTTVDPLAAFLIQRGLAWKRPTADSAAAVMHRYHVPALDSTPSTVVAQIYPTADLLPENQLKFYVHFSAPMQQGGAYRHVNLYDDSGTLVELPFLELDEELWDRSGERFTLFIDPGRIKLGVKPREDVGTALMEGGRFALVVATSWLDAAGQPLQQEFRKEFQVGSADRTSPDPALWTIREPSARSRDPLTVEFGESLDHALLQRLVWVYGAHDGRELNGNAVIGPDEASWNFVPTDSWAPGAYEIHVATLLEDLAGNNIAQPFDRDVTANAPQRKPGEILRVSFEVRP